MELSRTNLQTLIDAAPTRQGKDFASSANMFSSKAQLPNVFTKPDLNKMMHMNSKLSLDKMSKS